MLDGFDRPSSNGLTVAMKVGRADKSCGFESREDKRSPPSVVLVSVVLEFSAVSGEDLSTGGDADEIARRSDAKSSPPPDPLVFMELLS